MHTLRTETTIFNYNSDLSGKVHITVDGGDSLQVSGYDLLRFIANFVQRQRITALEHASIADVLGIPHDPLYDEH